MCYRVDIGNIQVLPQVTGNTTGSISDRLYARKRASTLIDDTPDRAYKATAHVALRFERKDGPEMNVVDGDWL